MLELFEHAAICFFSFKGVHFVRPRDGVLVVISPTCCRGSTLLCSGSHHCLVSSSDIRPYLSEHRFSERTSCQVSTTASSRGVATHAPQSCV